MNTKVRTTPVLRRQVGNAFAQHEALLRSVGELADAADDERVRQVCAEHQEAVRSLHDALREYADEIGAERGLGRRLLGRIVSQGAELVETDEDGVFLGLAAAVVMSRQSGEVFATFAEAGDAIGDAGLKRLGEKGVRIHRALADAAAAVVREIFIEQLTAAGEDA